MSKITNGMNNENTKKLINLNNSRIHLIKIKAIRLCLYPFKTLFVDQL